MIKSIKLVPHTIAMLTGAAILINTLSIAHAGDPSTRRPYKVIRKDSAYRDNTPYNGPYIWGHDAYFQFKIVEQSGALYELGKPQEWFSERRYNGIYKDVNNVPYFKDLPDGIAQGGPTHDIGGTGPKGAYFADHNAITLPVNTGSDSWWYSFTQTWHIIGTPYAPSPSGFTTTNPHHVQHNQAQVYHSNDQ